MADKPSKRSARNKKKVEKVEKSDEHEEANFDATVAGQDTKSSKNEEKNGFDFFFEFVSDFMCLDF